MNAIDRDLGGTANDALDDIARRYHDHLKVLRGPRTTEQFSKSPYFRSCGPSLIGWYWDEYQLRLDQASLARAYIENNCETWKSKYFAAMEQHGFCAEDLERCSLSSVVNSLATRQEAERAEGLRKAMGYCACGCPKDQHPLGGCETQGCHCRQFTERH